MSESKAAPRPYRSIESDLRRRIREAEWSAGSKLPARKALAQEYGVALNTIERALSGLLAEGSLRADDRRGTFVAGSAPPPLPAAQPLVLQAREARASFTAGVLTAVPRASRADDIANVWLRTVIHAIERALGEAGGGTRFFNLISSDESEIPLPQAVERLLEEGVDGLALVGLYDEPERAGELACALDAERIPLVYASADEISHAVAHVFHDQRAAGYLAARHLLSHSFGELMFFAPFDAPWVRQRAEGARDALEHAGLPRHALQVLPGDAPRRYPSDHRRAALEAARALLPLRAGVGIIAANDSVALGLIEAAEEAGQNAGDDFGIIGFDDTFEALAERLSSLRPPLEAIGSECARLLLLQSNGDRSITQVRLRSRLVPRASSRPLGDATT